MKCAESALGDGSQSFDRGTDRSLSSAMDHSAGHTLGAFWRSPELDGVAASRWAQPLSSVDGVALRDSDRAHACSVAWVGAHH